VGVAVSKTPEGESDPHSLPGNGMDDRSTQPMLDAMGLESQAEDGVPQVARGIRIQEQARLARIAAPVASQEPTALVYIERQADAAALSATSLPCGRLAADQGLPLPETL
jgi:hypothetical protein